MLFVELPFWVCGTEFKTVADDIVIFFQGNNA